MESFRPEVYLLLDCARTHIAAQQASRIKSLISQDIEWPYLLRMARRHRITPLLYRSLNSTCPDAVPNAAMEELRSYFYANAGRNLFLTKELLTLLRLLQVQNIAAIPYKGPVLAGSIYGNLGLREFGDLDILVRERDYERAQSLLMSQGFRLTIEHEWEAELVDDSGRVAVDLHKRIASQEFPSCLDFNYFSKRVQPIDLLGATATTLCPEDTLLMLSIQLTKDAKLQLSKLCDIAQLLCVYQNVNWVQLLNEAKKLGGCRMLVYALCLTNDLLGTAFPQQLSSEMPFHSSIKRLVAHVRWQFCHPDEPIHNQRPADCLRWIMQERVRDQLRRHLHDLIVPCELDRRVLRLPRELSFLYYFIRLVRLMGKHGSNHLSGAFRNFRSLLCARHIS